MTPEKRLEKICKSLQISRQNLADALGISLSSVAMYFTGQHKIRKVVALAIQGKYGINADWIIKGKKPVFLKSVSGDLSQDSTEVAMMYHLLPGEVKKTAKVVIEAMHHLDQ